MKTETHRHLRDSLAVSAALIICLALRFAVLMQFWGDLDDDRDAYLGIAQGLIEGRGFSTPGTETPTAFRPPLYPLILAVVTNAGTQIGVAVLHLALAVATFCFIYKTARQLGLSRWLASLPCFLYAVDPLSLRYLAFPMTETLSAFLVILLMWLLTKPPSNRPFLQDGLLTGLVFGAAVLCRPTFWPFGGLFLLWWIKNQYHQLRTASPDQKPVLKQRTLTVAMGGLIGIGLFIMPWTIRNLQQIGSPVFMTTHGGYTLLLGNNPAFYKEVVRQPYGTIWDGSKGPGQAVWYDGVLKEMDQAQMRTEIERDRWQSQKAKEAIQQEPATFIKACLLKFLWFWSVTPHASSAGGLPAAVIIGTGLFYTTLWMGLAVSVVSVLIQTARNFWNDNRWMPFVLLLLATTLIHLAYWSDARMRTPLMPAIVLLVLAPFAKQKQPTAISAEHQDS